ncbi:MAG TPA: YifB family Mg chelatase-like AAA ATPase, partial [bacterium]|nr:YifB family Mg chelatase-like AAA ATPase [bacterium]
IKNSGFGFPVKKIIVNLAPAGVKKEGAVFDLAIAVGILASHGEIERDALRDYVFLGELSLNGSLRKVKGMLSVALFYRKKNIKGIILPLENCREASIVKEVPLFPARNLREVAEFLKGKKVIAPFECAEEPADSPLPVPDFEDVKGQVLAKKACEVAAAGAHNLLFVGPPGTGKSMLAQRFPGILPELTVEESLETTRIYSVSGLLEEGRLIRTRPFRSPHHTISDIALVGGGSYPRPGEISLANNGVLFLDELPEFNRGVLETLRAPMEERVITISRVSRSILYPADFMLLASMNPCPCGFLGHPRKECVCGQGQIAKYRKKISGPILDRIDLQVEVPALELEELKTDSPALGSEEMKKRVQRAREIQRERYRGTGIRTNSHMGPKDIKRFVSLHKEAEKLLEKSVEIFSFSARVYHRLMKISRTIADLEGSESITGEHVAQAVQFRNLDKPVA